MQLSDQAISDFKKIYQDIKGVLLSDEEANAKGIELLKFIKLIYRPILKEYDAK